MAEWHTFQLVPDDERSPFRATVMSPPAEPDFGNGYIRIAPHADIGEALLKNVEGEGDHDLDFWVGSKTQGAAAIVIAFAQKESSPYKDDLSGRERIAETTQALLDELSRLVDDGKPKEES